MTSKTEKISNKDTLNTITAMSAEMIASYVVRGEIGANEVVSAFQQRIDDVENNVHAWESLDYSYAIEQATQVQVNKTFEGNDKTLLAVPIGVKDVINTEIFPTKMGSTLWSQHNAGNDARVLAHLRWQGAIIMGKTVTAEFAVHEPGKTHNPHDKSRTPGTSSSGSAAAVATAMVPVAIGTQTAGSLIRPASYCGVYAYKPTFGWLPRTGVLKTTDTLDQIGFHARYATDLRILFEAGRVRGRDHVLKEKCLAKFPDRKSWTIGLVKTHLWDNAPDYAKSSLTSFISQLSNLDNIDVVDFSLPQEFEVVHDVHGAIYDSDLSYYFRHEVNFNSGMVSDELNKIIKDGMGISGDEYRDALEKQVHLTNKLDKLFESSKVDVILSLSSNGAAPIVEPIPYRDPCAIYSLCGVPTVNIPVFKSPEGLPFGAQIVSRKYADYTLLSFIEYLVKEGVLSPSEIVNGEA